jgi:hypothetical protein
MLSGKNYIVLVFILCSVPLIAQDKEPVIDISSSIRASVTAYSINGQDNRQEPFSFFLHGRPVLTVKGFDIPVSFIFSNHHKSIQQPFNRFGISPTYKWARIHLGYNTMQLSKYTFSNRQFLGAGVELNPGKFRLAALAGRLQAAVREDSIQIEESTAFLSDKPIPRFERRAIGGKIGFGTTQSYFDIVGMRAFDVQDNRFFNDTTELRPQENTAVGIHSLLKLTKTLTLRMDVASSVYTRDTTSDDHELDKSVAWIGNILQPKTSTQVLFAGEIGLGYKVSTWGIQLNYKRIDPDFKSMGVYYLQSDISQWTIAPQVSLLQKKLHIRSSFGIQQNNLYNTRLATNKRNIQSVNMQWNPAPAFQLGAFYSNFGLTQTPGLRQLTDSTRVSQVNSAYGLTPSFQWKGDTWQHQLFATLSQNKLSFNKSAINAVEDVKTTQFNGTYTLSPQQDNRFSVGGVFTWLRSDFGDATSVNTGFGGTGTLSAFKGKWNASGLVQYFINRLDENENGHSLVVNADIQYTIHKSISFFLLGQLINNDTGIEETSFTERQMTVGLQLQF